MSTTYQVGNANDLKAAFKKPVPDLTNHHNLDGWNPITNYDGKQTADASTHKPLPYREQSNGKKYLIELPKNPIFAAIQPDGAQVTMVDWLRVTTNIVFLNDL